MTVSWVSRRVELDLPGGLDVLEIGDDLTDGLADVKAGPRRRRPETDAYCAHPNLRSSERSPRATKAGSAR